MCQKNRVHGQSPAIVDCLPQVLREVQRGAVEDTSIQWMSRQFRTTGRVASKGNNGLVSLWSGGQKLWSVRGEEGQRVKSGVA